MYQFQPLGDFLPGLLAFRRVELLLQFCNQLIKINLLENVADGFRSHFGDKRVTELFLCLPIFRFGQKLFRFEGGLPFIDDEVVFVVDHPL